MKLVKEHINKFERGLDPKAAMGTGVRSSIMKFLEEKGELTDEIGEMSAGFSDSHLLIYCCKYGKTEWVKFLIDQGANVNTGDSIPLEWAVIKEYNDIINILLKAGAKPYSHKVNFTKIKKSNKKDNFTLGESINFERGLDPKDAMDTGAAVNILGNEPGSEFKVIVLQELTDMEKIHVFPTHRADNVYKVKIAYGKDKNKIIFAAKFNTPFGKFWGMELKNENYGH